MFIIIPAHFFLLQLNKNNYHLYRWRWIFTLWLIKRGDVKVNSVKVGGNICNLMSECIAS